MGKIRKYEAMVVMDPFYSGENDTSYLDVTKGALSKFDAKVNKEEEIGKKKLAYEIRKRREGSYLLVHFEMDTDLVSKLKREWTVSDAVLTYMILQQDEAKESVEVVEKEKTLEKGEADGSDTE